MEFRLLGTLEVLDSSGAAVQVRGAKMRSLLAVLLLEAGRPVSSDRLGEILWGDDPPAGESNALQAQISKLRRLLSGDDRVALEKRGGGYVLDVDPSWIDANRFERMAGQGRTQLHDGDTAGAARMLREALALWHGPALADFVYDSFADTHRTRLEELRLAAHEDRIDADIANGHHDLVIAELETLVAETPLRERLWGQLMLALYRTGRQSDALRAYQRAREHLARELGLDPGPQLRQLEARLLEQDPDVDPPVQPARTRVRRSNLAAELSELFGRGEELEELTGLVGQRRLTTLVGPGGVGKTRLATETALRTGARFADGAWLVELAGADDARGVLDAFVGTFGPAVVPSAGIELLAQLTGSLRDERMLIVVDNCEHVLAAAAEVIAELLRGCPAITVLATSREPLGVPGEVVRVIRPLPLADAVAMFAGRASQATDALDDDAETARGIEAVCRRVDCLPLSIELAAARLRAFSVAQLAELLRDRLKILSTTTGGRPSRQQNLQATVDWSYRLLFADEQRLLDRLSIFNGGFSLDAVMAVCTDDFLRVEEIGLLLARLVEKSLVVRSTDRRYHLLAAVAEYATSRLAELGETESMRASHRRWLETSTTGLTRGLRSADPFPWARALQGEELNLFQTAKWALAGGDIDSAIKVACQISWYSFLSANLDQDVPLLLTLLERADHLSPEWRCRALMWAGLLTIGRNGLRSPNLDSFDTARAVITYTLADAKIDLSDGGTGLSIESVELARTTGSASLLAEATSLAAFRLAASGTTPEVASALVDESLHLAAQTGDTWTSAFGQLTLGMLALGRGDADDCHERLLEARAAFTRIGDIVTAALVDVSIGEVAFVRGDLGAARSSFGRAADVGSAAGFQASIVLRSRLVWLTCCDNDAEAALDLAHRLAEDSKSLFNPVIRAHSLFALGCAESSAGLDDDATDDLGEALSIYARFGVMREGALCQTELGYVAGRRGRTGESLRQHRGALAKTLGSQAMFEIVRAAIGLAAAHVANGHPAAAANLVGFVEAKMLTFGHRLSARDRQRLDDLLEQADRLPAAERMKGAAMSRADLAPFTW